MHKPRAWSAASERFLIFRLMERREVLDFGLNIKDANLYMVEHLCSTMYFQRLSYWTLVKRKIGGQLLRGKPHHCCKLSRGSSVSQAGCLPKSGKLFSASSRR